MQLVLKYIGINYWNCCEVYNVKYVMFQKYLHTRSPKTIFIVRTAGVNFIQVHNIILYRWDQHLPNMVNESVTLYLLRRPPPITELCSKNVIDCMVIQVNIVNQCTAIPDFQRRLHLYSLYYYNNIIMRIPIVFFLDDKIIITHTMHILSLIYYGR